MAPPLFAGLATLALAAAACGLLTLVIVVGVRDARRRSRPRAEVRPQAPAPPTTSAAPPPPDAGDALESLAPAGPALARPEAPEVPGEEAVLPAIPADSDEWKEGRPYETMLGAEDGDLPSVASLIEDLKTGNPQVCHRAVEALVRHGRAAEAALEAATHDPDPDVRVDAAEALARIREGAA